MDDTNTSPAYFALTSRLTPRGRRWRWNLVAGNGEVVASSEAYNSREAAAGGIAVVRRLAPGAAVRTL